MLFCKQKYKPKPEPKARIHALGLTAKGLINDVVLDKLDALEKAIDNCN